MSDQLPAGPEVDRLVAEGPMRWTRKSVILVNDEEETEHYETGGPRGAFGESNLRSVDDFNPSTNIAHAWEVVEKMTAMGEFVGVMWNGQQWECALNKVMRKADAAPMAICLAALAALRPSATNKMEG